MRHARWTSHVIGWQDAADPSPARPPEVGPNLLFILMTRPVYGCRGLLQADLASRTGEGARVVRRSEIQRECASWGVDFMVMSHGAACYVVADHQVLSCVDFTPTTLVPQSGVRVGKGIAVAGEYKFQIHGAIRCHPGV